MDVAWRAAFSVPDGTDLCVHAWECATPPIALDGSSFQLGEACDGGGRYRTVTVDHAALLRLEDADEVSLTTCAGNGTAIEASTPANEVFVELDAGTSFLASTLSTER